jgi:hypothetical protein
MLNSIKIPLCKDVRAYATSACAESDTAAVSAPYASTPIFFDEILCHGGAAGYDLDLVTPTGLFQRSNGFRHYCFRISRFTIPVHTQILK